jgi:hypothetical protein
MLINRRSPTRLGNLCRKRCVIAIAIALAGTTATPVSALTQSWNGYHWARTGPLQISLGDNLGTPWAPYLAPAAAGWSAAKNIDFKVTAGKSIATTCGGVYGTVQVCNSNYGATGWLGYANVWLSGGFIVQGTVKLNDYYFNQAKYNTTAWRNMTICQEIGHTLGLAHTNTVRTDLNTGSCMDYSNDPSGTVGGSNGTLANVAPNNVDYAALDGIYAKLDATQLTATRPTMIAGEGFSIDGFEHDTLTTVPEPANWALLIAGFGIIGAMQRRQRRTVGAIAYA